MENQEHTFQQTENTLTERPDFLKIVCIISFIGTGLMLLVYSLGSLALALGPDTIDEFWPKMIEKYPQFQDVDGVQFFHDLGIASVYGIIANVFTLIGVIMMWRLERMGFYIYLIAEFVVYFFGFKMETGEKESGYGSLIFSVFLDLVFLAMYIANLKYMKGKQAVS